MAAPVHPGARLMVHNEISDRARAERLAHIRNGLVRRMRDVCHDTPDDLFQELVDRMALIQLKYELHQDSSRPSPDPAPHELPDS